MWNFLNGGQLHRFFNIISLWKACLGSGEGEGGLVVLVGWTFTSADKKRWQRPCLDSIKEREKTVSSHMWHHVSLAPAERARERETVKQRDLLYVSVCCERLYVWRTHILMLWSGVWDGPLSCPSPPLPASARRFTPGTLECSWDRVWVCGCAYLCVYITVGKATKLYPFKKVVSVATSY